jgi:hypothetical protein
MRKLFSIIFLLPISVQLMAQSAPKKLNQANWQQHVAYTISVKLDDNKNALDGKISMVYTNNSPDVLNQIYMHVWPNAYANRNTAFAKQHLENGKTDFYFAKPADQGSIDSLNFTVNNSAVKWNLTNDIDIALLTLNQPLKPGEKITISTPFYVQLPKVYSRLGHEKQLYCITQWFPKPAVYDVNGWNPIPYLDQGEFYSEFGSFDVSITLPKNYVLAATGNLQNKEEETFLNKLAESEAKQFEERPLSSSEFKTVRYIQDSVHDFAWFASKEFNVKKGEVTLQNGKKIATWLFAKRINNNGIDYINEGVKYYSDHIGNYPYNLAQVVITPLEAGGGMEYPTITNCASIDRTTIIHEVGHNWFYGILGSNEREHPWMDESLNTYYESRCTQEKEDETRAKTAGQKDFLKDVFNVDLKGFGQARLLYGITARKNEDQAGNLPSTTYTDFNYGAIIYAKNPLSFYMLQNYLGNDKFDAMMHAYYEKWKFKHPLPNDFRNHAENFTNENLGWFFDEVLGSTKKMDYRIVSVKKNQAKVKNISGLKVPFSLSSTNQYNTPIKTKQIEGFTGTKTFDITSLLNNNGVANNIQIDQNQSSIELYRKNNAQHKPLSVRFLPALENPNKRQIFCIPLYAWNKYNGNMLGLFINNDFFPDQKTEFNFTPLYSFTTNDLNGYLSIARNFHVSSTILKNIKIGVNTSRFGTVGLVKNGLILKDINGIDSSSRDVVTGTTYEKLIPYIEIDFKQSNARSLFENKLILRHVTVLENKTSEGYLSNFNNQSMSAMDITYKMAHNLATYPTYFKTNLQVGTANYSFTRLSFEVNQGISYNASKKKANIRLFAGTFINEQSTDANGFNQGRTLFQAGGTTGNNDYFYDEAMFGRAEGRTGVLPQQTFLARQVLNRDAGFRNFVAVGNTNTWLTSANLTLPAPFKLPIGFYSDAVFWEKSEFATQTGLNSFETKLTYVGGVYISLAKNVFEIYFPLFASQDVTDAWGGTDLNHPFERASFILNLNSINPIKLAKNAMK